MRRSSEVGLFQPVDVLDVGAIVVGVIPPVHAVDMLRSSYGDECSSVVLL